MHFQQGFTLIELMLALAIAAIMTTIGYPAYVSHQVNAERARAEVALMQLSGRLEGYFNDNGSYEGATLETLNASDLTQGLDYRLQILTVSDTNYEIQAVPMGIQETRDFLCGSLSLTDTNKRSISGSGDIDQCWI
ncbi:MAG: prepilin-type N-terminal cleavage/methylation domain-containing protein [Gammaproteobacteria bacterium]|nr:prepilin-type N-terminal cleavage/methylation domain-containing protein [Gammaproteobacteria bacterium]